MPYFINHTNGTSLVTIADGTVDSTATSISLVGKNFPTYGQILNQNIVTMLENSANSSAPNNALLGQLWYDSYNKQLKFYREGSTTNAWQKLATTIESATAPTDPTFGDLWWDTANTQLKLYDINTAAWRVIGPQTTSNGQLNVIGTNSFAIQVGGNTVFSIDQYGGVVESYNPCVYGYDFMGATQALTSNGVTFYNTWNPNILVDNGSNFNTTTGVFTVKTAGVYAVNAVVTSLGGDNSPTLNEVRLQWWQNQQNSNVNSSVNHTNSDVRQLVCMGFIQASVNDTIQLVYSTTPGASISNTPATYSIRLVG
jgi:hypothetical protein